MGQLAGALPLVFVLFVFSMPILKREERRRGRTWYFLLLAALAAKLLGSVARFLVALFLYGGVADAVGYHSFGAVIARAIWEGRMSSVPDFATPFGTNFIRIVTGFLYALTGPNIISGFVFFAWLSFIGTYLLYRAYCLAFPQDRSKRYAWFLFFMPTMVYWPSSIGKESWMIFALGIAFWGGARCLTGSPARGMPAAVLGCALAAIVRPHMGALFALSLVSATLVQGRRAEGRRPRTAAKVAFLLVGVVGAAFMAVWTSTYLLNHSAIDTSRGLTAVLQENNRRTEQGGSEFEAPIVTTPKAIPLAAVTVLFRPFPFEANNAQALASSLEGTALLWLVVAQRRRVWACIRSARQRPYVAMVLVYMALFVFVFSSVGNFGILVRQRAQVYPFLFLLLCAPLPRLPVPRTASSRRPNRRPVKGTSPRPEPARSRTARAGAGQLRTRSGPVQSRAAGRETA